MATKNTKRHEKEEKNQTILPFRGFSCFSWPLPLPSGTRRRQPPGRRDACHLLIRRVTSEAAAKALLRGELTVRNHAFYLEGGKLCGYQTVTARDRDRLVAELNKLGSVAIAEGARKELAKAKRGPSDPSEESLRRLEKAG